MTTLAQLKKNSKATLDKIRQETEKLGKPGKKEFPQDTRFWRLSTDEAGNGYAVIRFLPAPPDEDLAFVRYWDHFFRGPSGKIYNEKSLTTLGMKDPVGEMNSTLWNAGGEESPERKQARDQKRREHFVANILVINDPEKPENNGKEFLFRFGKKIFENKIKPIMFPDEDLGEEPNDPFSFWTGQNFKLKCKKVAGYPNYDESSFMNPSQIAKSDDEIDKIWRAEYSLKEFKDPSKFKTYDELKARLEEVLNGVKGNEMQAPAKSLEQIEADMDEVKNVGTRRSTGTSSVDDTGEINLEDLLKDI